MPQYKSSIFPVTAHCFLSSLPKGHPPRRLYMNLDDKKCLKQHFDAEVANYGDSAVFFVCLWKQWSCDWIRKSKSMANKKPLCCHCDSREDAFLPTRCWQMIANSIIEKNRINIHFNVCIVIKEGYNCRLVCRVTWRGWLLITMLIPAIILKGAAAAGIWIITHLESINVFQFALTFSIDYQSASGRLERRLNRSVASVWTPAPVISFESYFRSQSPEKSVSHAYYTDCVFIPDCIFASSSHDYVSLWCCGLESLLCITSWITASFLLRERR